MGLQLFQIVLNNAQEVYYGGQQLIGNVRLKLDKPKKARGVNLKIQGIANVRWKEKKTKSYRDSEGNHRTRQETRIYTSEERYFNNTIQLWVGRSDDSNTLDVGEYNFPFNCTIPYNVPSSFEATYGNIRYTILAVIDRPWKFDNEEKISFRVICPLDLNLQPNLRQPMQTSKEKTFCCCCCASGPLSVVLSLPVGGVVPGDIILPTVEVDNTSRVNLTKIKIHLVKIITYRAEGRVKEEEVSVSEILLGEVKKRSSHTWANNEFIIPDLPPSNLTHCTIMDIIYYVKLSCTPSGAHTNLTALLPLIVGSVPLSAVPFSNVPHDFPPGGIMPPPMVDNIPFPNQSHEFPPQNILPPPMVDYIPFPNQPNEFPSQNILPPPMVDTMPFPNQSYVPSGQNHPSSLIGWNVVPTAPQLNDGPQQQYPDMSPPSYNEAVAGGWKPEKDEKN